jgi:hypothetical protein
MTIMGEQHEISQEAARFARSPAGTIEVLTQARDALFIAGRRERVQRFAACYRLHARECDEEIQRIQRAIAAATRGDAS